MIDNYNLHNSIIMQFSYEAVFAQHKTSKILRYPDIFMNKVYNFTHLLNYHFFVMVIGLPWVISLALINSVAMWAYAWVIYPVLKLTFAVIKVSIMLVYGCIGIALQPCGKWMHKCIMRYCGHRFIVIPAKKEEKKTKAKIGLSAEID